MDNRRINEGRLVAFVFGGLLLLGVIISLRDDTAPNDQQKPVRTFTLGSGSHSVTGLSAFPCSREQKVSPIDGGKCADRDFVPGQELEGSQPDERQAEEEQKRKQSEAAGIFSYWPTTIRVDTDMDSFWLNNEERTCQTYPDSKGRIAAVVCNPSGSHHDHNIPVKFWGGVNRNAVTDWNCRRENDEFVCRATD
jgi:hypothetical protein